MFRKILEWNAGKILKSISRIGKKTQILVDYLFLYVIIISE